jgi:hypothetical protein
LKTKDRRLVESINNGHGAEPPIFCLESSSLLSLGRSPPKAVPEELGGIHERVDAGNLRKVFVLGSEVEEDATNTSEHDVGDPNREPRGQVISFAEVQEEVVDEDEDEENKDGTGDPTQHSAP